jgi:beta-lactamase regulating signal transducer with metallopeptidase domain
MSSVFITVLNMSLTASYAAVMVMLVRFLLKRAPKVFSYALWLVVLLRLIIPVSFTSPVSLLPGETNVIPQDIVVSSKPAIKTGLESYRQTG